MKHDKSTYLGLTTEVKRTTLEPISFLEKNINLFNRLLKEYKMLTASHGRSWPRDELKWLWGSNKNTRITFMV